MAEVKDDSNTLDDLEDQGLITYNENNMPVKTSPRHLREAEVLAVLLPLVVADFRISSREIGRITGLDARTVNFYRKSDKFAEMLATHTNKSMISVRNLAVEELEKLLKDKSLNANTKIKAIAVALSHSERVTELMLLAGKDVPTININDLMLELENM